jgi:glycosyltransferase involved in cell wall biosynthesis
MIVLAYIGVHQIFQLALAAQEGGALGRLFCSVLDAPGRWGGWLARLGPAAAARPMGAAGLPAAKVSEIPWPLLARQIYSRLLKQNARDYYHSNVWFDRLAARKLKTSQAQVFVGTETCALACLREARRLGMKTVLDCPGIPAGFLAEQTSHSAQELQIEMPIISSSPRMLRRKALELAEADHLLVCSEFQKRWYVEKGFAADRIHVNPLWVDPAIAKVAESAPPRMPRDRGLPLRVLFVGQATVSKGAPYALLAAESLGDRVQMTFCGGVDSWVRDWAGGRLNRHRIIPWMPREELPKVYQEHDVLVFPTLGDSFGFVALEAMSFGLPVIATTSVGAPLPNESWRVPPRDPGELANRLRLYDEDRDQLECDAKMARDFVRGYTPEAFRQRAQSIFQSLA